MQATDLVVTRRSLLRRALALGGGLTLALCSRRPWPPPAVTVAAGQVPTGDDQVLEVAPQRRREGARRQGDRGFPGAVPEHQSRHTITDWPSWDETYTAAYAVGARLTSPTCPTSTS